MCGYVGNKATPKWIIRNACNQSGAELAHLKSRYRHNAAAKCDWCVIHCVCTMLCWNFKARRVETTVICVCVCVRLLELRNVHFFLSASARVCCLPAKQCVRDEFLQILSFNQAITIYQQIYSVYAFCAAHSFSLSFTARLAVLWAAYCRPSGNGKGEGFVAMALWQIVNKNEMQTYKRVSIDMHSAHIHTHTNT